MLKDWNACAREVGKALSRYDGHTTFAAMENILRVPGSPIFEREISCYAGEIISEIDAALKDQGKRGGRRYAQDHLQHAVALGFVDRIISGGLAFGGAKGKVDETARIAISPTGRAYRAAKALKLPEFREFLTVLALLEHDFDMYGTLLILANENTPEARLGDKFKSRVLAMFSERKEWLETQIPSNATRGMLRAHIQWMRRDLENRTLQHHFTLRRKWGRDLGHLDDGNFLTEPGCKLATHICNAATQNAMFWLAPTPECVRKIGALQETRDKIFSAWRILCPDANESNPSDDIIDSVADFMENAFSVMRSRMFAQAPLAAIIPYIYFQESQLNERVNLRKLFDEVFRRRNSLWCQLGPIPSDNHYQLRVTSSTG